MNTQYPQNGERKKGFSLAPAKDDTFSILQGRMEVLTDADLSDGAARLYCLLVDLSLNPDSHKGRRGTVCLSMLKLACIMGCSEKSVNTWKNQLLGARYIWKELEPWPNTWSHNRYHISSISPFDVQPKSIAGLGIFFGNGHRMGPAPKPVGRDLAGKFYGGPDELSASKLAESEDFTVVASSAGVPSPVKNTAVARKYNGGAPYKSNATAAINTAVRRKQRPVTAVKNDPPPLNKTSLLSTEEKETIRDLDKRSEGEKLFPVPTFEDFDWKMFQGKRPKSGELIIEDAKRQKLLIEDNPKAKVAGKFIPAAQNVIDAYNARIRATKAWMAGRRTA